MKTRIDELLKKLDERTPKQMRTLRNQLNNRIKSFEDELQFGKKVAKISESHSLFGLTVGDCKDLLIKAQQKLRGMKKASHDEEE
jgi:predicted transglutaminase-like cysteine proteinase